VAELTLHTDGKVIWNTGTQLLLGDPKWVNLFWDAAEQRLGVRAVNATDGLPVSAEPEGSEFMIDSAAVLAEAGISVASNLSAEPVGWYDPDADAPVDPLFGYPYQQIFYITLP
jgi:hypothetical protein